MKKSTILIIVVLLGALIVGGVYMLKPEEQKLIKATQGNKLKDKIIIGVTAELAPMEYKDDMGNIIGIDITIAREIAAILNKEPIFKNYTWEDMLAAAETGEVDFVISSIIMTPERKERLLFSEPYFEGGQIIVARKGDTSINKPEDLKDKVVGVVGGTACEKAGKQYVTEANLLRYDSFDRTVTDTINKKIDATIIDYIIGLAWEKENPELKAIPEPFTTAFYGIATKKENIKLMDEINGILREMKRAGRIKAIENSWKEGTN